MALYPQFILFGDSLLQNAAHLIDGFSFAAALQSHYIRQLDVVNRGLSGYNTSQVLEVLPRIIPTPSTARVEFLLILLGANDACLPDAPTNQHVDLEEYRANLKSIISHPHVTAHQPKIILVTPPPIDEVLQKKTDQSKGMPLCRRANVTRQYADAAKEVGKEFGKDLLVLDLWSAVMDEVIRESHSQTTDGLIPGSRELGENKTLSRLLPDGLHFSGPGYKLFFELLMSSMKSKWTSPATPSDAFVLPEWREAPRKAPEHA